MEDRDVLLDLPYGERRNHLNSLHHPNYTIRSADRKTIIGYRKTAREWAHFVSSAAFGAALTGFPAYLLYTSKPFGWKTNTVLSTVFFSVILLWGLFKIITAFEILLLPSGDIITIDHDHKKITARLSFFGQRTFRFEDIDAIQLSGEDTAVSSYHHGRTYKRRLYSHVLQFQLRDGTIRRIHRFMSRDFFIPILPQKETYEVTSVSKHIAKLIAAQTGIHYKWLGTKKD